MSAAVAVLIRIINTTLLEKYCRSGVCVQSKAKQHPACLHELKWMSREHAYNTPFQKKNQSSGLQAKEKKRANEDMSRQPLRISISLKSIEVKVTPET